jgi:NitT/TauT family transport system permease protein
MTSLRHMFTPNGVVSNRAMTIVIAGQVLLALLLWFMSSSAFFPTPSEIGSAWLRLMRDPETKMGWHFLQSFTVNIQVLAITTVISLVLAYSTVVPFMRPIVQFLSTWRFMGIVGFTAIFTLLTSGGHQLKVAIMVFGMSVWYITSMLAVIMAIPKERFDHARTLGMGPWRTVWEVVVLGKGDEVFEVLRQNAAIGWLMLTTAEGLVRTEGGLGALLLVQNRHMRFDSIYAIQITILFLGLFQDSLIGGARKLLFPYAFLGKERS